MSFFQALVYPGGGDGLQQKHGQYNGFLYQRLLSRVPRQRTTQDFQDLGVYGYDGTGNAHESYSTALCLLYSTPRHRIIIYRI